MKERESRSNRALFDLRDKGEISVEGSSLRHREKHIEREREKKRNGDTENGRGYCAYID